MKKIILFVALISLVTVAGYLVAQKACISIGTKSQGERWYENIGLSKNDSALFKDSDALFRTEMDKVCTRICKERADLIKMMKDPNPDRNAIERKIEQIGKMQIELEKQIAVHILDVTQKLPAEHRQAYIQTIERQFIESVKQHGYFDVLQQLKTN